MASVAVNGMNLPTLQQARFRFCFSERNFNAFSNYSTLDWNSCDVSLDGNWRTVSYNDVPIVFNYLARVAGIEDINLTCLEIPATPIR